MEDMPTIHLTKQQVEALLEPFVIEVLQEEDGAGQTDTGRPKQWHCFHIVARKR
jgi:tellurite methyltransferase